METGKLYNVFSHESENRLWNYGSGIRLKIKEVSDGTKVVDSLKATLTRMKKNKAPISGIYPASIFFQESNLIRAEGFMAMLKDLLIEIDELACNKEVKWIKINSVVTIGNKVWQRWRIL